MHTLLVFATCLNLPEYGQADIQTRMEIEWAAVLHDLDKDGPEMIPPIRFVELQLLCELCLS